MTNKDTTKITEIKKTHSGTVALIGRANTGKSTLLNTLLGEKVSIVSKIPQTTRLIIRGILNNPSGQIVFLDSPGIHTAKNFLGKRLNLRAEDAARGVDLIVYLVDLQRRPGAEETRILQLIESIQIPYIVVLNKMDKGKGMVDEYMNFFASSQSTENIKAYVPISALTGKNTEELLKSLYENLPESPPIYPLEWSSQLSDKILISEFIREKLLQRLKQEIPHELAVLVRNLEQKTTPKKMLYIDAEIFILKPSQKGIVIGHKGTLLKQVGTEARHDIEKAFNTKVFLNLWVKVNSRWMRDPEILREMGYIDVV